MAASSTSPNCLGCDPKTIHQGLVDLADLPDVPPERCRKKGVDANACIDTDQQLKANFQKVLEDHTAGNPMKPDTLWTNLSVSAIADRLAELGTPADRSIVEQLLEHSESRPPPSPQDHGDGTDAATGTSNSRSSRFYKDLYLDSAQSHPQHRHEKTRAFGRISIATAICSRTKRFASSITISRRSPTAT